MFWYEWERRYWIHDFSQRPYIAQKAKKKKKTRQHSAKIRNCTDRVVCHWMRRVPQAVWRRIWCFGNTVQCACCFVSQIIVLQYMPVVGWRNYCTRLITTARMSATPMRMTWSSSEFSLSHRGSTVQKDWAYLLQGVCSLCRTRNELFGLQQEKMEPILKIWGWLRWI